MRVAIHDLYRRRTDHLEGDAHEVEAELARRWPGMCAEVDPDDGLQELLDHLDSSLQGFSFELQPADSFGRLGKVQPAPSFPALGVEDRRPTSLVTTERQLAIKHGISFNHAQAQRGVTRASQHPDAWEIGKERYADRAAVHRGSTVTAAYHSRTGPPHVLQNAYATAGALAPGRSVNGPLATQQHENFHAMLDRVAVKHGEASRRLLVQRLWEELPPKYRERVDELQSRVRGAAREGHETEEKLARLLNYVNDPQERDRFHGDDSAVLRQAWAATFKRSLQIVRAAAARADESWLHPRVYEMSKGEVIQFPSPALRGATIHDPADWPSTAAFTRDVLGAIGGEPEPTRGQLASATLRAGPPALKPGDAVPPKAPAPGWGRLGEEYEHHHLLRRSEEVEIPGGDSLAKMALGDVRRGQKVRSSLAGGERFSYSHLLSHEQRGAGYRLHVEQRGAAANPGVVSARAILTHPEADDSAGGLLPGEAGGVGGDLTDGTFHLRDAYVAEGHRGGKGVPLYEALLAHAKNCLGATSVSGGTHSTTASRVHQKLAAKHGLGYVAKPNYGADTPTAQWASEQEWEQARTNGVRDERYQPYEYALKSEDLGEDQGEHSEVAKSEVLLVKVETDYSHLLPPGVSGYRLTADRHEHGVSVALHHGDQLAGAVDAGEDEPGVIVPHADLAPEHRSRGLGVAMYEALYAHAREHGIHTVRGHGHTEAVARVHRSLARKHGFTYEPGYDSDTDHGGYEYSILKREAPAPDPHAWDFSPGGPEEMLGLDPEVGEAFAAAAFLAGGSAPHPRDARRWVRSSQDLEAAALSAFGLGDTEENRSALRSVAACLRGATCAGAQTGSFRQGLSKAEELPQPQYREVLPLLPGSEGAAEAVKKAATAGEVQQVKLGGKHSAGSAVAKIDGGPDLLLKPGSGPQSPAAGAREDPSSQSRREAAFYRLAGAMGLEEWVPRAELLRVDGRETAAIELLPARDWKSASKVAKRDPGRFAAELERYRTHGILHRWACLDWCAGNPDRHNQNALISRRGEIRLIDHGSAFAGAGFDPAHDGDSFVPFYLRPSAPGDFHRLPPQERLRHMLAAPPQVDRELLEWLAGLDPRRIGQVVLDAGIDPAHVLERLARLRALPSNASEAINRLWAAGG